MLKGRDLRRMIEGQRRCGRCAGHAEHKSPNLVTNTCRRQLEAETCWEASAKKELEPEVGYDPTQQTAELGLKGPKNMVSYSEGAGLGDSFEKHNHEFLAQIRTRCAK